MTVARARRLRRSMTRQEALLWTRLRVLNREGIRIRRQAPMGDFIVDFACHSAKLVIELDGSGHAEAAQSDHDRRRDAWLASRGYEVIRIWNGALYEDHDTLVGYLIDTLRERAQRNR
ncbi:MAG: DUF559 domain-containing protein [Oceanicaulis sp.]